MNQRLQCDKNILSKKLNEAKAQIVSLQEIISKLNADKEALKCQISLEGRICQYAVSFFINLLSSFSRRIITLNSHVHLSA